ncbi:cytochrome c oxidase biogenesis protein Cmc1 like-domain-containing protein [Diplogelasinospora grovesii]|uniref:COX assembly mitochondrial protein n=1 Tax=Diplogelasinospora grovesii TaxID=303347 RepID=A0AAN6NKR7_9PEZI|nr:cytochrome c oxidase biogenesis protein Cmc1 like-domain-containing protein [Diplogelasinospora grovesii]
MAAVPPPMPPSAPVPLPSSDASTMNSDEMLPMPSRNPIPLSASQEAQVRDIYYARVRRQCADEIKAFADCALGRTFSVPFACREPHRIMNSCMKSHATPSEYDAAREEWFAQRLQRQKEREKKARRKAEQEAFLREWWGLPEKDREVAQREMEKLKRGERIGGFPAANRPRIEEEASKR